MALNFILTHMHNSIRPWYTAATAKGDDHNNVNYFLVAALSTGFLASYLLSTAVRMIFRRRGRLPPGPTGLPIVGYLPFLGTRLHHKFSELADTYGPIYKLWLGRKLCVVVNSPSLAREVVRDKDAIFANRDPPIASLVVSYGGDDVAFSDYGPTWKKLRKALVREMLSSDSLECCYKLRKKEVRKTVREVHKYCWTSGQTSVDIGELAFKTTTNAMISMLWGGGAPASSRKGGDFFAEFRELESELLELMGTPNVSDFLPALARFDLQGIEKKSKRVLKDFDEILSSVIEERLVAVKEGGGRKKDFLQVLLDLNSDDHDHDDDDETSVTTNQVKALLMDILVGGTDTTATMIEWTMAELMKHPGTMAKVNRELDQVVGQNDIVNESHLPKLNYLEAVIKETFRLHPAVALLVPRCPSQTCKLGGYTIPKGTTVYLNVYGIHRDAQLWDEPLEFKPDRFLDVDDKFDFQGNNFQFMPFGSGRRICPGQGLGVNTEKYVLATLLHLFAWKLPHGTTEVEMSDTFGTVMKKKNPLVLVPAPKLSNSELYMYIS